jgi:hypothetical protein
VDNWQTQVYKYTQVDFFRRQVPDLKVYLQQRGITCHLYRKPDLVKLCELAQELQLETVTSLNDYEQSHVTVTLFFLNLGHRSLLRFFYPSTTLKKTQSSRGIQKIVTSPCAWGHGFLFCSGNAKKTSTSLMHAYFPRFLPSDLHCGRQHQSFEDLGLFIWLWKTFYLQIAITSEFLLPTYEVIGSENGRVITIVQFTSIHVIDKRKYRSFRWNGND